MFSDLKAMVVVLVGASIVFAIVKPLFLQFMLPEDFGRRRNLWLVLTVAGFVSPNMWIYVAVALPALIYGAYRDSNPVALWLLLLFVIPPVDIPIPTVLVNHLFTISQMRLLGIVILFPIATRLLRAPARLLPTTTRLIDFLVIGYGAYLLALALPYENITNTMRRAFLYVLDGVVVYYVFSRVLTDRRRLVDAMAAFCLACIVVAPLAVFESARSWLLYTSIAQTWGAPNELAWLLRDDSLRAQLATGHAITMGYVMANALAFWLYLKNAGQRTQLGAAVILALSAAIIVSYARATWIMAALLPILMLALAPTRPGRIFKSLVGLGLVAGALMLSPLGARLVALLPFVGTGDQQTVAYRQQLAETSWMLVQQHPWFGDPFAYTHMEDLRQGQGLIDMVNAYAGVAVFQGLVGLFLYAAPFFLCVLGAYRRLSQLRGEDHDLVALGASLIACMISTLIFMATVPGAWLIWAMVGMLVAYAQLEASPAPVAIVFRQAPRFGARPGAA